VTTPRPGGRPPRALRTHLATALVALGIAFVLLTPLPASGDTMRQLHDLALDKLVHVGLAAALSWRLARSLELAGTPSRTAIAVLAAAGALLWTAGLEPIQGWLGREASWWDALADGLGAMTAASGWWWRQRRSR
jgi:VanZ family protein